MDFQKALDAQPHVVRHLHKSKDQSKLSHAYIFEGSKDSFVEEIATFFAILLMSDQGLDDPVSQRIIHRTHPNVKFIEAASATITKDDILALQHDFNQTALEAGPKVYLIFEAEKMNAYAANALLKFLEEPHPQIYGVLTTHDASKLLPTIVSRSQVMPFLNTGKKVIERQLIDEGVNPFKAKLAAQLYQRFDRAFDFTEDADSERLIELTKGLYKTLLEGQSLLVYMHQEFPEIGKDKRSLELLLELMMLYLKDVLYAKMKGEVAFIFSDELPTIEALEKQWNHKQLITLWENILNLKEKLQQPIHHALAFEDLILSLERGTYEA